MGQDLDQTDAEFVTTHWGLIGRLRSEESRERQSAAAEVAARYWPPVYAYARRLTRSRDEAADLTQAFFVEVVLGRGLLERADAERGRVRSLVRSALRRFAADAWRREAARGAGRSVPLGDLDLEDSLVSRVVGGTTAQHAQDSESVFDRRWALSMFQEALDRCEAHFVRAGRPGHWRLFEARVVTPAIHGNAAPPLADAAGEQGFESAAAGAAAVQTVKRRLDVVLRSVIAETVEDAADAADEHREVLRLLGVAP